MTPLVWAVLIALCIAALVGIYLNHRNRRETWAPLGHSDCALCPTKEQP